MNDALLVARQVLAGGIDPSLGCGLIAEICKKLGHPIELTKFEQLNHDQYDHEAFGIDTASCVPEILGACRDLVAAQA